MQVYLYLWWRNEEKERQKENKPQALFSHTQTPEFHLYQYDDDTMRVSNSKITCTSQNEDSKFWNFSSRMPQIYTHPHIYSHTTVEYYEPFTSAPSTRPTCR